MAVTLFFLASLQMVVEQGNTLAATQAAQAVEQVDKIQTEQAGRERQRKDTPAEILQAVAVVAAAVQDLSAETQAAAAVMAETALVAQ
jgi:hypothetical protein